MNYENRNNKKCLNMKYENYLIKIQYPLLVPSQCQLQCYHAEIFYVRHNIPTNHNSRQFKKRKKKKRK